MIRLAINGFGRIGRTAFKIAHDKYSKEIDVVAINDIADSKTLAHLLKYDSNYGVWDHEVSAGLDHIKIDNKVYKVLNEKDPLVLPWKNLAVDVVIESTGKFTDKTGASQHLQAGAKKVIISAPATRPSSGG